MGLHSPAMRLVCIVFGLLVLAVGSAGAGTSRVLVMSESDRVEALQSALRVALGGKRMVIASSVPPHGQLRLDRAAVAQHEAVAASADAAVWIDIEGGAVEVCVVSSDGRHFRHAPLPPGDTSPRVFAAIATSLLDELSAPPEGDGSVHVDVHVTVGKQGVEVTTSPDTRGVTVDPFSGGAVTVDPFSGRAVTIDPFSGRAVTVDPFSPRTPAPDAVVAPTPYPTPYPMLAPPSASGLSVQQDTGVSAARPFAHRTLVEFGPMLSPISAGVEANLLFPAAPAWRFGVMAAANILFMDDYSPLFAGALELRYVGSGHHHPDVGLLAGAATAEGDTVAMFAVRFQFSWDNAARSRTTAVSLAPVALYDPEHDEGAPGAWGSVRWGLPI